MRPHRRQPTRLPCPWDSPGTLENSKNTGVGCYFLLQCTKVKSESEVTQSCPSLNDPMDYSLPGSSVRGIFQAKEYWSGVPLPSPIASSSHRIFSRVCSALCPLSPMMLSNHFILYYPSLLLPSLFPSIRIFPNKLVL